MARERPWRLRDWVQSTKTEAWLLCNAGAATDRSHGNYGAAGTLFRQFKCQCKLQFEYGDLLLSKEIGNEGNTHKT